MFQIRGYGIMTCYNPRVYNYSNLRDEDKQCARIMYHLLGVVKDKATEYNCTGTPTILEQIENEIAKETIDEVVDTIELEIVEFFVDCIDHYNKEIKMIDTNDYFYGLKR